MRKILVNASALLVVAGGGVVIANSAGADGGGHAKAAMYDTSGTKIGVAQLSFQRGGSNIRVEVQLPGSMAGFHGFHIHSVGQCVAPFTSAGGHLGEDATDPNHRHRNHEGDLPVLLVKRSGKAWARFDTNRIEPSDLLGGDGAALIIHAGPDNYANIPTTDAATGNPRYSNPGAVAVYPNTTTDDTTLRTGDAGGRIACGVIRAH